LDRWTRNTIRNIEEELEMLERRIGKKSNINQRGKQTRKIQSKTGKNLGIGRRRQQGDSKYQRPL